MGKSKSKTLDRLAILYQGPRLWIERYCQAVNNGETPDQETLIKLRDILQSTFSDIDRVTRTGADTKKLSKILLLKFDLLKKPGRESTAIQNNLEFDIVCNYLFNTKIRDQTYAMTAALKDSGKDKRTIQRYIKKHKKSASSIMDFINDGWKTAKIDLIKLSENLSSGPVGSPMATRDQDRLKYNGSVFLIKPLSPRLTKEQENELRTLTTNGTDFSKLLTWWGNYTVYNDQDVLIGSKFDISKCSAQFGYDVMRSILSIYGTKLKKRH